MLNGISSSNKTDLYQKLNVESDLTKSFNLAKNTTSKNTKDNIDTVEISGKALSASKNDLPNDQNISLIYKSVDNDPKFADQMAYTYSHSPDFEIVDLKDVPISRTLNDMEAYLKHENNFEIQSKNTMNNRIAIYNQMKADGASGAKIFKKIMEFNKTLPIEYQKATGIDKYFLQDKTLNT